MSKIGDLWVRLGLKKESYSRGLKEAANEGRSWANTITTVMSKAKLAFAAVTAVVGGVILAIKNLSVQNQALSDGWGRMTAGMEAAWDSLRTSVAKMDFSHLLSDMREAGRLARELYDAQDALGEIGTSYNISLARQMENINKLRVRLRDLNLSDDERIAAGKELLQIYNDLEKNPTRGLLNVSEKTLDASAKKLGYSFKGATEESMKATRQEVENFFVWLGSEAGESWNQAYADAYKDPGKLLQTNINAQNAGLSANYRALLWNYQAQFGDKDRERMEKAVTAYYEQRAKFSGETMRIENQINSILAQRNGSNGGGGAPKVDKWEEYAKAIDDAAKKAATEAAEIQSAESEVNADFDDFVEKFRQSKGLTEPVDAATRMWNEFVAGVTEGAEVASNRYTILKEMGEEAAAEMEAQEQKLEDIAKEFNENVAAGFADGAQTIMDSLMGLENFNAGAVLQALLTPLADMAVKEGEILVASGLGLDALKDGLTAISGAAPLAAGLALIAIGTAAKSGLAALAKNGAGSTTTSVGGDYGSGGSYAQNLKTEMTIYVSGKISGNDIEISGQRTVNDWSR